MKLLPDLVKRLLPASVKLHGRDSLLFQRLFWGAMAGCLATLLLAESPILETMELSMLEWRYKVSNKINSLTTQPLMSRDIAIVEFDDISQFDLSIARFNDRRAQEQLAQAVEVIEKGLPLMVVIDLDLRGASAPKLLDVIRKNRNVVIGLFGNLEGSTELPAPQFLTYAKYGYDELPKESDGVVCRLPINYHEFDASEDSMDAGLDPMPSLTEAVIDLHRDLRGVGPSSKLFAARADRPLYISYKKSKFPSVYMRDVLLEPRFDPNQFKDKIVLIGSTITSKNDLNRGELKRRTPLKESIPDVSIQAGSISTLLNNQAIGSFPINIAHHLLLLLGAAFGAIASILPIGLRTVAWLGGSLSLVALSQLAFQAVHLNVPVAPPLAVLALGWALGTFIYLDTDLRLRNRELAQARESMQVRAEEERQRIAEDLHDETLPALSSVARLADRLANDEQMRENPVPALMREKLDHAVSEMRRVINDLHPSVLETMGFKPALENLVAILAQETRMETTFTDVDALSDYDLSNFVRLQLYRIVQEGLNNVQKHSEAKNVELNLNQKGGYLAIKLIDDGKGIDPKAIRRDAHGLLNIRQRAQLIGAQVEWKKPDKYPHGTEMRLKIPVEDKLEEKIASEVK